MLQTNKAKQGLGQAVLPLTTQPSLFGENDEVSTMNRDHLWFRANSENLRENGLGRYVTKERLRELAAESLQMTFKAMAGREGATPFLKNKAQNEAIAKCMTGDLDGQLEALGINTDAFLDQVKKTFPVYGPFRSQTEKQTKIRESLIRFSNLIYERLQAISVQENEIRQREKLEDYDEFF